MVVTILWLFRYRQKKETSDALVEELGIVGHQNLSYHELHQATNNFNKSHLLGVGSYGSVYKGILSDTTIVAVKILNLSRKGAFKSFDRECEVLRRIRHRNLVKVITTCSTVELRALVLQYKSEYLYLGIEEAIVHCDFKPSNVLLDDDMVAHVGDFGISKIIAGDNVT